MIIEKQALVVNKIEEDRLMKVDFVPSVVQQKEDKHKQIAQGGCFCKHRREEKVF